MKINLKGVKIKEEYYKHSRRGKPPMKFSAYLDADTKKIKRIIIKKDPILKKYPKYEDAIRQHELIEAKLRSKGYSVRDSHGYASELEPKLIRHKNLKQLWREMK